MTPLLKQSISLKLKWVAAAEQRYYQAWNKCDTQLGFPVFCSAHIALLNQAIQAGARQMLRCLRRETWCCYSRRQFWSFGEYGIIYTVAVKTFQVICVF